MLLGIAAGAALVTVLVASWLWGRSTLSPDPAPASASHGEAGAHATASTAPPAPPRSAAGPAVADIDPLRSAAVWLRAQRTVRYDDPVPTAWIDRVRPVVTDRLAAQNERLRDGSAGAGWTAFVAGRCVTDVRSIDGVIPPEAPRTPDRVSVQIIGTLVTTCDDPTAGGVGEVDTADEALAATVDLVRGTDGLWRVDDQLY